MSDLVANETVRAKPLPFDDERRYYAGNRIGVVLGRHSDGRYEIAFGIGVTILFVRDELKTAFPAAKEPSRMTDPFVSPGMATHRSRDGRYLVVAKRILASVHLPPTEFAIEEVANAGDWMVKVIGGPGFNLATGMVDRRVLNDADFAAFFEAAG